MGNFTRPIDLLRHQKRRFSTSMKSAIDLHSDLVKASLSDAYEFTSGSISSATLRRLGHPFGRGRSKASSTPTKLKRGASAHKVKVPNLPINVQSGQLRRSWYRDRTVKTSHGQVWTLGNRAPHAKYILSPWGTKKMVGRGIWGHPSKTGGAPIGQMARRARARNKALIDTLIARQRTP